jgi:hypothetical protein
MRGKGPIRKIGFWGIWLSVSSTAAYLIFISSLSIWTGLIHWDQAGSWLPVLAGAFLLFCVSLSLCLILRRTLRLRKREGLHV